jgi:hypothetical protein
MPPLPSSSNAKQLARTDKRDSYFPGAAERIWDRKKSGGYATIPKTLLLISHLLGKFEKDDYIPSTLLGLWLATWDNGFIDIGGEADFALECGFLQKNLNRRIYEWRRRIEKLEAARFIEVVRSGEKNVRYVLVLNPHQAFSDLYASNDTFRNRVKGNLQWRTVLDQLIDKAFDVGARELAVALREDLHATHTGEE